MLASALSPFFPRSLPHRSGRINLSGAGKAPGSAIYLDLRDGSTIELYVAQVTTIGPLAVFAQVAGNQGLSRIQVDAHVLPNSLLVGDVLLVGSILFGGGTPLAKRAWLAPKPESSHGHPPVVGRPTVNGASRTASVGVIAKVADTKAWGFISAEGTSTPVFVHHTNLLYGAQLVVGRRVQFELARNEKGLTAFNVRPA